MTIVNINHLAKGKSLVVFEVTIKPGIQKKIHLNEGDTAEGLARDFAVKYGKTKFFIITRIRRRRRVKISEDY